MSAAARQRRHRVRTSAASGVSTAWVRAFRARQRTGTFLVKIEVDGPTRDELAACGLLREWDVEDAGAVTEAVEKLLRLLPEMQGFIMK